MAKRILLIEDEKLLVENIVLFLQSEGYDVLTATNGADGLKMAQELQPDAIICDILLPKMDGFAILETLRQDKRFETTPFIILSAKAEKSSIKAGLELGADEYIIKPFSLDDLLKVLATHLENSN
ncbi:MAG: response regulator [Chloroflexi bacterium]|uniref:Response regulator n=1 Tax=Candidatus Chlorohelix allophototropha TaxID=3003348 RepID=A0A8T7M8V4_9CHLR|nr:response regulator [Chloroflexota bacterium]WJW68528.1 response regulator [Chloroflexota bacterium L227-S17]